MSTTAKSARRRASAASVGTSHSTSAAGNRSASFAKVTAARAPGSALASGPRPGGSAPSEAAGSASLRITAAERCGATVIRTAPDSASRGARPSATARRRVTTTDSRRLDMLRNWLRVASVTRSAATARTAPFSPSSSTGSPRRKATIASSSARPPADRDGSGSGETFGRSTTQRPPVARGAGRAAVTDQPGHGGASKTGCRYGSRASSPYAVAGKWWLGSRPARRAASRRRRRGT